MDIVSSFTNNVVSKALDGLSQRHVAISSNLANVDTPEYKRKVVTFEDQLGKAIEARHGGAGKGTGQASNDVELVMTATAPEHFQMGHRVSNLGDVQPELTEMEDQAYRTDNNSVDVESEMVNLAKNTEHYVALANLQSRLLRGTRAVINNSGGG